MLDGATLVSQANWDRTFLQRWQERARPVPLARVLRNICRHAIHHADFSTDAAQPLAFLQVVLSVLWQDLGQRTNATRANRALDLAALSVLAMALFATCLVKPYEN
jgi:hypothetical protein